MKSKKLYVILDDKRERLEDFIADKILKRFEENKIIDNVEKVAIITALDFANAYLVDRKIDYITEDIKENIANAVVKGIDKANVLIQKQLKKKSKIYLENHKE